MEKFLARELVNEEISFKISLIENSRIPKYKQIVDSIIHNISIGKLKIDQKLPSINMLSEEFYLSRDTVEKAYNILKRRKIITPIRGKGYYVARTKLISKVNVLFLINKLSSYKMRIYNSFINNIGGNSHTDLHIYHCDKTLFLNLIDKNLGAYDYYVIMPHFKTDNLTHISSGKDVLEAINKIPKDKLVILDNNKGIEDSVIEICQDYENDIYGALKEGLDKICRYNKLILIYPQNSIYPYPRRILNGFRKFCVESSLDFEILDEVYDDIVLKKGDLFITIEESDLVSLVKQIRDKDFELGKEIGVISYNDTPLKELLGITVISTDFKMMGATAASMILNKESGKIKNPFNFIDRNSI
jgi:DNA-binding transcriptional regulator YhcF (GntR family)